MPDKNIDHGWAITSPNYGISGETFRYKRTTCIDYFMDWAKGPDYTMQQWRHYRDSDGFKCVKAAVIPAAQLFKGTVMTDSNNEPVNRTFKIDRPHDEINEDIEYFHQQMVEPTPDGYKFKLTPVNIVPFPRRGIPTRKAILVII